MIRCIATGRLVSAPEQRTSKASGKPYTYARMAADQDGDQTLFARVYAFGDAGVRLAALHVGDAISVAGRLQLGIWTPDGGTPRVDATVLGDELLAVRRRPREQQHDDDQTEY